MKNGRRFAQAWWALPLAAASFAALVAGCGSSNSVVGGSCAPGYTQCDVHCVLLETDPAHCGSCDNSCTAGGSCTLGRCSTALFTDASSEAGDTPDASVGDVQTADEQSPDGTLDDAPLDGAVVDGITDGTVGDGTLGEDAPNDAPIDSLASEGGAGEAGEAAATDGAAADVAVSDVVLNDAQFADGACMPGVYNRPQACGDCVTVCGAAAPRCGPVDGGFACSDCASPTTNCSGLCADTANDPFNCGACGTVCASQICQGSRCIGATTGGIVLIGHDYQTTLPLTTQARVLSNAIFLPQTNPLRILIYDRNAKSEAVTNIKNILDKVATQGGVALQATTVANESDVPSSLSLLNYDVFLVLDQVGAPPGFLATLGPPTGANWASAMATFAHTGGVIVILDGGTGTGEMPAFTTSTGLLSVAGHTPVVPGTALYDVARGDVEGVGLLSPYGAGANTVSVTADPSGGNVVYVVVTQPDGGPSTPVVIHKVF